MTIKVASACQLKLFACCLLLGVPTLGCGERKIFPVHGRIVDPQGNPVKGLKRGAVEFQSLEAKASANASIDDNGNFQLSTEASGDGAHLGRHRVAILRPHLGPEHPVPLVIDAKYEKFETSGLEVTVEPKNNEVQLKVQLYKGGS